MVLEALHALRFEVWAWRVSRAGRARLQRMRPGSLRVHLGCGADIRDGWLNIDLQRGVARENYVNYDLRCGLPLPAASCSYIYSSHFIEHLSVPAATRLFADCHRVLQQGGVLRFALPDFRRAAQAYAAGDAAYFEPLGAYCGPCNTITEYMDYVVHQHGEHRSLHAVDSLRDRLARLGFAGIREVDFDVTVDPADAMRKRYSLYVSARK
ncbi:MAG: class I SAM-dependent methyltransferase [Gemmatimonadota bacterium]